MAITWNDAKRAAFWEAVEQPGRKDTPTEADLLLLQGKPAPQTDPSGVFTEIRSTYPNLLKLEGRAGGEPIGLPISARLPNANPAPTRYSVVWFNQLPADEVLELKWKGKIVRLHVVYCKEPSKAGSFHFIGLSDDGELRFLTVPMQGLSASDPRGPKIYERLMRIQDLPLAQRRSALLSFLTETLPNMGLTKWLNSGIPMTRRGEPKGEFGVSDDLGRMGLNRGTLSKQYRPTNSGIRATLFRSDRPDLTVMDFEPFDLGPVAIGDGKTTTPATASPIKQKASNASNPPPGPSFAQWYAAISFIDLSQPPLPVESLAEIARRSIMQDFFTAASSADATAGPTLVTAAKLANLARAVNRPGASPLYMRLSGFAGYAGIVVRIEGQSIAYRPLSALEMSVQDFRELTGYLPVLIIRSEAGMDYPLFLGQGGLPVFLRSDPGGLTEFRMLEPNRLSEMFPLLSEEDAFIQQDPPAGQLPADDQVLQSFADWYGRTGAIGAEAAEFNAASPLATWDGALAFYLFDVCVRALNTAEGSNIPVSDRLTDYFTNPAHPAPVEMLWTDTEGKYILLKDFLGYPRLALKMAGGRFFYRAYAAAEKAPKSPEKLAMGPYLPVLEVDVVGAGKYPVFLRANGTPSMLAPSQHGEINTISINRDQMEASLQGMKLGLEQMRAKGRGEPAIERLYAWLRGEEVLDAGREPDPMDPFRELKDWLVGELEKLVGFGREIRGLSIQTTSVLVRQIRQEDRHLNGADYSVHKDRSGGYVIYKHQDGKIYYTEIPQSESDPGEPDPESVSHRALPVFRYQGVDYPVFTHERGLALIGYNREQRRHALAPKDEQEFLSALGPLWEAAQREARLRNLDFRTAVDGFNSLNRDRSVPAAIPLTGLTGSSVLNPALSRGIPQFTAVAAQPLPVALRFRFSDGDSPKTYGDFRKETAATGSTALLRFGSPDSQAVEYGLSGDRNQFDLEPTGGFAGDEVRIVLQDGKSTLHLDRAPRHRASLDLALNGQKLEMEWSPNPPARGLIIRGEGGTEAEFEGRMRLIAPLIGEAKLETDRGARVLMVWCGEGQEESILRIIRLLTDAYPGMMDAHRRNLDATGLIWPAQASAFKPEPAISARPLPPAITPQTEVAVHATRSEMPAETPRIVDESGESAFGPFTFRFTLQRHIPGEQLSLTAASLDFSDPQAAPIAPEAGAFTLETPLPLPLSNPNFPLAWDHPILGRLTIPFSMSAGQKPLAPEPSEPIYEYAVSEGRPRLIGISDYGEFVLDLVPLTAANGETRYLVTEGSLAKLKAWMAVLNRPIAFDPDRHTGLEAVIRAEHRGGRTHYRFLGFHGARVGDNGPWSPRTLEISRHEGREVKALMERDKALPGARSALDVDFSSEPRAVSGFAIDDIRHGDAFVYTDRTLEEVRQLCLENGGLIPEGRRLRLDFVNTRSGLVISVPVITVHRPTNPFKLDIDPSAGRAVEQYYEGYEQARRPVSAKLRPHDQGGGYEFYYLDPVDEDGRIKAFQLEAFDTSSPVVRGLACTLDGNRTDKGQGRALAADKIEKHYERALGGEAADQIQVRIPGRKLRRAPGEAVFLEYVSDQPNTRGFSARLSGLRLDEVGEPFLILGDTVRLTVSRESVGQARQETAFSMAVFNSAEPGVLLLRETGVPEGREPMEWEWNRDLNWLRQRPAAAPDARPSRGLTALFEKMGFPVGVAVTLTRRSGESVKNQKGDAQLHFDPFIPVLPPFLQAFPGPVSLETLEDPDRISALLARIPLHHQIFSPIQESLFAQTLIGRSQERMVFTGQSVIVEVLMTRQKSAYHASIQADSDQRLEEISVYLEDPDRAGHYYKIKPHADHEKRGSGVHMLEVGLTGRNEDQFNLHIVSSDKTYSRGRAFGLVAEQVHHAPEEVENALKAIRQEAVGRIEAQAARFGVDRAPDTKSKRVWTKGGKELVELEDGKFLEIGVADSGGNNFKLENVEVLNPGTPGAVALMNYLDAEGESRKFVLYRSPDGGALFFLVNDDANEFYYFIVSDGGEIWMWKGDTVENTRAFQMPPNVGIFLMGPVDGGEAYASKSISVISRSLAKDQPAAGALYDVSLSLGRWNQAPSATLLKSAGEKARLIHFQAVIAANGALSAVPSSDEDEFDLKLEEDRWTDLTGQSRLGRLRLVFYRKHEREKGPYATLTFKNREEFLHRNGVFKAEASLIEENVHQSRKVLFEEPGYLTRRAGVKITEEGLARMDRAAEPVRAILESLNVFATGASHSDTPVLLRGLEAMGLTDEEGNYGSSDLAHFAAFSALKNPEFQEAKQRSQILYEPKARKKPTKALPIETGPRIELTSPEGAEDGPSIPMPVPGGGLKGPRNSLSADPLGNLTHPRFGMPEQASFIHIMEEGALAVQARRQPALSQRIHFPDSQPFSRRSGPVASRSTRMSRSWRTPTRAFGPRLGR